MLLVGMFGGSAAKAAFSGRNGLLAAQPAHGRGALLIDPRTGRTRLICRAPTQCGHPTNPRWGPDGRQIAAVDSVSGRVVVVTSAGACVVCTNDRPFTDMHAQSATFLDNEHLLVGSDEADPQVVSVPFATSPPQVWFPGRAATLASSSSDLVAFSRRGWVWLGGTRWTPGSEPALDAHGKRLTFVRGGWVRLIELYSPGGPRRLVKGSQPAFSPDGRQLAFISPRGRVVVLTLRTMRTHEIGRALARSLDWGPAPPHRNACDPPAGDRLATVGHSVLWQRTRGTGTDEVETVWGCDETTGIPRKLLVGLPHYDYFSTPRVVLGGRSGRYAAIESISGNRYEGGPDVVQVFDLRTGRVLDTSPELCSGSNSYGGCAVVDSLQVNDNGFAAWHQTGVPGQPGLTLPSPEEVLAADDDGVRVLDRVPPGGAPTLTNVTLGPNSVTWEHGGVSQSATLR